MYHLCSKWNGAGGGGADGGSGGAGVQAQGGGTRCRRVWSVGWVRSLHSLTRSGNVCRRGPRPTRNTRLQRAPWDYTPAPPAPPAVHPPPAPFHFHLRRCFTFILTQVHYICLVNNGARSGSIRRCKTQVQPISHSINARAPLLFKHAVRALKTSVS